MTPSCGNCNAWKRQEGRKDGMGSCMAHPPQPTFMGVETATASVMKPGVTQQRPVVMALYPTVHENAWCREWQAAPMSAQSGTMQ